MDDPQIAIYIGIEEPKNTIQYGGVVVAPMVKEALEQAISILNIGRRNNEVPFSYRPYIDKNTYIVPNFIGCKVKGLHNDEKFSYKVIGNGATVFAQLPEEGELLLEGGTITLYT